MDGSVKLIIALIICATIAYFVYRAYRCVPIGGLNSYQRAVAADFLLTGGDQPNAAAERVIAEGERIPRPTPMDHLIVGTVYLNNLGDTRAAHTHFQEAADQIERGEGHDEEVGYILGRIHDYRMFLAADDLPMIDVQRVLLEQATRHEPQTQQVPHLRNRQTPSPHNTAARIPIDPDDDQRVQKTILNTQFWASDPQNVHDSGVAEELARQYAYVKNKLALDPRMSKRSLADDYKQCYEQIVARLTHQINADETLADERAAARRTLDNVERVFMVLSNNAELVNLKCHEQDFLATIWQRAHQGDNLSRAGALETAIADCLGDCVENGVVVCVTGRMEKLWSALATLDEEPAIGIFKTRQTLLNEVSERAARIVDQHVGPNSTVAPDVLADFNAGRETEATTALTAQIKQEIQALEKEYSGRVDARFLKTRLDACLTAID